MQQYSTERVKLPHHNSNILHVERLSNSNMDNGISPQQFLHIECYAAVMNCSMLCHAELNCMYYNTTFLQVLPVIDLVLFFL